MATTSNCLAISLFSSYRIVKRAGYSSRNRSASARSISRLTPMMASPSSAYFSCMVLSQGNERLQGTHHEAQKSSTTTLPAYFSMLNVSDAETGPHANRATCATAIAASQVRNAPCLEQYSFIKYPVFDL